MIVQGMRCYFLYNLPVADSLLSDDSVAIGVTPALVQQLSQHFQVRPAEAPAFYTAAAHPGSIL